MPRDQNVLEDRALEFVVVRDQLPVVRIGRDLEEDGRHRIRRQPELRLAVVDRIDEAERLRRRIDRVDVGAAVAQVDGAARFDVPRYVFAWFVPLADEGRRATTALRVLGRHLV